MAMLGTHLSFPFTKCIVNVKAYPADSLPSHHLIWCLRNMGAHADVSLGT